MAKITQTVRGIGEESIHSLPKTLATHGKVQALASGLFACFFYGEKQQETLIFEAEFPDPLKANLRPAQVS